MAESNGSSSPDPIVLPSSPLISSSSRLSRLRPLAQKSPNRFASPSKSIVIDTPKRHGFSPWRIKVTVEAQPKEGELIRREDRPTSISVIEKSRVSSPAKRAGLESLEEGIIRRTPRRRKNLHHTQSSMDPEVASDTERSTTDRVTSRSTVSPLRQPPRRRSRMNAIAAASQRSRRLNIARDELDEALQSAIGSPISQMEGEIPGDVTVSANEDFSMVSMDSLLSARNNSLSHVLSAIPEQNKHVASSSAAPASPPKVQYPDISRPAKEARASIGRSDYDAMSWKPTGRPQVIEFPQPAQQIIIPTRQEERRDDTPVQEESPLKPLQIAPLAASRSPSDDAGLDDDIWQEEASRSLEEVHDPDTQPSNHEARHDRPHELDDIFNDQPSKPLRPKIPRTWRRSSGHDFSYVDSPAHVPDRPRKPSGTSTDGSGVLTPPSSVEEDPKCQMEEQPEQNFIEHSEFTQPDAVGTEFYEQMDRTDDERSQPLTYDNNPVSPLSSDSDSGVSSPDAEDTGLFWQSNLPNVYRNSRAPARPQRQTTVDLSDLLQSDVVDGQETRNSVSRSSAETDELNAHRGVSTNATRRPELPRLQAITGNIHLKPSEPSNGKVLLSPLRRSLLKSSKINAGAANIGTDLESAKRRLVESQQYTTQVPPPQAEREYITGRRTGSSYTARRYQSRYSRRHAHRSPVEIADQSLNRNAQGEAESRSHGSHQNGNGDRTQDAEMSRSYEEQLNLGSPAKIKVNFNDSYGSTSSLLASAKEHLLNYSRPLTPTAEHPAPGPAGSPPFVTLVGPKPPVSTQNILSRLSTNFWSAVIRPSGPTEILPPPTPISTAQHDPESDPDILFPPALRTQLRNRYGVVSSHFPWTMAHMRTLHRMLNSRETPRADTLIPSSGPLPPNLAAVADTTQTSVTGHRFQFTRAHALVVFAFAQVMVPQHVILAMRTGEVEWLGDSLARRCRGFYGDRHGDEAVWKVDTHSPDVVRWVDGLTGRIFLEFVVRALGDVVWSNEQLAMKQ